MIKVFFTSLDASGEQNAIFKDTFGPFFEEVSELRDADMVFWHG